MKIKPKYMYKRGVISHRGLSFVKCAGILEAYTSIANTGAEKLNEINPITAKRDRPMVFLINDNFIIKKTLIKGSAVIKMVIIKVVVLITF